MTREGEGSMADEDDDVLANLKVHPTAEPGYQSARPELPDVCFNVQKLIST